MKSKYIIALIVLGILGPSAIGANQSKHLETEKKTELVPSFNEMIVKVEGMVCSFCAFGTEKNLSKLNFIDKRKHGGDGVLVEVKNGYASLAIHDKSKTVFREIVRSITDGGYVATEMMFWVSGTLTQQKNGSYTIAGTDFPHTFSSRSIQNKTLVNHQVTALVKLPVTKNLTRGVIPVVILEMAKEKL